MKKPLTLFSFTVILLSCTILSCASGPSASKAVNLLPMSVGWYQYNFECTFKGIEDEYDFFQNTGIKMIQELTWKYTGIVCRFEDGVLYDPFTKIELAIDKDGRISCAENISINGTLEKSGRFFWSGITEEHGRLNTIFVKGVMIPLPRSVRGGAEYDGVYHMIDTGTGREQLVKISDGFYTWSYLDEEEAGFSPWPTLIELDGTFSCTLEITTVMDMEDYSHVDYSTSVITEGRVIPGQGITMEEVSRTSGLGYDQATLPQVYSGTAIRSGEYPNEAIPDDVETLVSAGRAAVKAAPKPNRDIYPAWYLRLPVKRGFLYAVGEKTFAVRETAFSMAEAAAAANLAEQYWVRIENEIIDSSNNNQALVEERIKSETIERLSYQVIERSYNDEVGTAFVLLEAALD